MGYKTGRPIIEIDWDKANSLMVAGCSGPQVAAALGVCPDSLYRKTEERFKMTFSAYRTKMSEHGEAQLIAAQHYKAIGATKKGDNTLLTYLGKVRLKQREPSTEIDVGDETLKHFDALMNQISNLQAKEEVVPEAASNEL